MFFTLLSLLVSPVFADEEISPAEETLPAIVRATSGGGVYHPLAADGTLTYDVTGPVTLEVDLRQRLPNASAPVSTVKIAAKGDGMLILTVKVKGGPDSASILDAQGGVPTVADRAEITVPPGQHLFTLEPIDAPYPLLARVIALSDGDSAPVVAVLDEPEPEREVVELFVDEPETIEEPEPEPEPEPDGPVWDEVEDAVVDEDAAFEEDLQDFLESDLEIPVVEEPVAEEPTITELEDALVVEEPEPEIPVVELFGDDVEDDIESVDEVHESFVPEVYEPSFDATTSSGPDLALGARVGMGASGGGNQASVYLGLEAVIGTPSPAFAVALRAGRYGVSYSENLPVQPALGGYQGVSEGIDWQTNVRAFEVAARLSPELDLPIGMTPYGLGGVAGYFSTRVDGADRIRSFGGGTTWALGLDVPAGPGFLSGELALNTGRQSFDNKNIDGAEARERVGGVRGNLSYRYSF